MSKKITNTYAFINRVIVPIMDFLSEIYQLKFVGQIFRDFRSFIENKFKPLNPCFELSFF